jgi:tetratricopeptide (TPR) repeat protein
MRSPWWGMAPLLLLSLAIASADTKETPVGLVLSGAGTKMLRADTETPLDARPGDLLFARDGLRTAGAPASFLFCPAKTIDTLSASGEVRLDDKQPKVKTGKITEAPARSCSLPPTLRVAAASQQHYGVTMSRGLATDVTPTPRDKLPADVKAELAPLDAALAADANDQASLIAVANVFENHKLLANSIETYHKLLKQWPDAVWIKSKIFDLEQALAAEAAAAATPAAGGQTFALLVGISKFSKPELSLQFANADADVLSKFLASPRGGGLPPGNIMLLTDANATTAAVRLGFQDFLKRRAGKNDTVIILVASHGTVDGKNAYILTYDSDPQDLKSTALPMAELQSLFTEQLSKVGRVLLFVDVCKSGTIGTIQSTSVNTGVAALQDVEGQLLGLMAGRKRELSFEGPDFGGGHGAFSYFVLKGLQGAADEDGDGTVDGNELIRYVTTQVPKATGDKQHPTDISPGNVDVKISDVKKPGIELAHWRMILDSRTGEPRLLASTTVASAAFDSEAADDVDNFTSALDAGRILPEQPDNAFTALQKLKAELNPEQYTERENQLRVALENKAQEVLLRYLQGEESPQTREEFDRGGRYMEAARILTRESLYLEGRQDFFQGRALLFDKNFPQAAQLLEQAVRIDPGAAYGFNALGIAYLEQAQYAKAIPAFHDAVRRAQHWAYPLHNQALAYVEIGDYKSAIRSYQEAIRLSPKYSYLPYNLGLVYQRLNRRKDAEASYKQATLLAPNAAEPYNALGTLKAAENKPAEAERLYKEALQKNPALLPARHNLAVLLAGQKNRQQEAIGLWRENLQQKSDYLPSRLSLAEALANSGDNAAAIEEYRKVLAAQPGYVAARLALAGLLAKTGDAEAALRELREVSKQDAQNFTIFEQIGDIEAGRQHSAEAKAAYQSALGVAPDRAARKRIGNKLKSLP